MTSRISCYLLLASYVLVSGCERRGILPVNKETEVKKVAQTESRSPGRAPKPTTCNAFGEFKLAEAGAKDSPPERTRKLLDEARVGFEQALQLDPKNAPAFLGLAKVHLGYGSVDRAIEVLQAGVKQAPKDAGLWMLLGKCHSRKKEWPSAIGAMQQAIKYASSKDQRSVAKQLGFVLARAGRIDEGLGYLKQAMPEDEANYYIARMLEHIGRGDLSPEYLQAALHHNPEMVKAQKMMERLKANSPAPVVPANLVQ